MGGGRGPGAPRSPQGGRGGGRSTDDALVATCLAALLGAVGWGWLQGLAAVAEAWRGAVRPAHAGVVRRLVLAACGVALTSALVAPAAYADPPSRPQPRGDVLSGLPLPERATGAAHRPQRSTVVRPGDTLWALAATGLPPSASAAAVTERWQRIYARNRPLIGPDPDLIRPGQILELPKEPS